MEDIMTFIDAGLGWLAGNKEWLFSGAFFAFAGGLFGLLRWFYAQRQLYRQSSYSEEALESALERFKSGRTTKSDISLLRRAYRTDQLGISTSPSDLSTKGGNISGSIVINGDRNVVLTGIQSHSLEDALRTPDNSILASLRKLVGTPVEVNRGDLLKLVRTRIEKGLTHSLRGIARIDIPLEDRSDAVEDAFERVLLRAEQQSKSWPPGTRIGVIFEEVANGLLILGAPGSGKTTLLLELALDLLDRADKSTDYLIPVVLNLSTWAMWKPVQKYFMRTKNNSRLQNASLEGWLEHELSRLYGGPEATWRQLIANSHVCPLLDGLDEIASEHRGACVEAINLFRQDHGQIPIALCSRLREFEQLKVRLHLGGGVLIPSLSREQVTRYLERLGSRTPLKEAVNLLQADRRLWKIFDTPLMLNIARLALRKQGDAANVLSARSVESGRSRVFEAYVNTMLEHRSASTHYKSENTRHWLTQLAHSMVRQGNAELFLEEIQASSLPPKSRRKLLFLTRLTLGTIAAVITAITLTPLAGVVFGLIVSLAVPIRIRPVETLHWSWRTAGETILTFFMILPLIYVIMTLAPNDLLDALRGQDLRSNLHEWWASRAWEEKFVMFIGVIPFMIHSCIIPVALWRGFDTADTAVRTSPNEGIIHSLKHALIVAGIGMAVLSMIGGLLNYMWIYLSPVLPPDVLNEYKMYSGSWFSWCIWFLVLGMILGLGKGGLAYLKHYILRMHLWSTGYAPLGLVHFLERMTECAILQKTGGGYSFIHRTLLEYFVELEQIPSDVRFRLHSEYRDEQAGDRLKQAGFTSVIQGFMEAANNSEQEKFFEALRLSSHALTVDEHQLPSQLLGRLSPEGGPAISSLLERASLLLNGPTLRPLTASLTRPGGPLYATLAGHQGQVNAIAITEDGRYAATASGDRTIKIWDVDQGRAIHTLIGHTDGAKALCITADGSRLVSAANDRTMRLWDIDTGKTLCAVKGYALKLAISRDGRRFISAELRHLKLWHADGGRLIRKFPIPSGSYVRAMAFSADEERVTIGLNRRKKSEFMVFDIESGNVTHRIGVGGDNTRMALSSDATRAISITHKYTELTLWDMDSGKSLWTVRDNTDRPRLFYAAALSANGDHGVVRASEWLLTWSKSKFRSLPSRSDLRYLEETIVVSSDGRHAISAFGPIAKVWDLEAVTDSNNDWAVRLVSFMPNNRRVVSCDGISIKLWDPKSGQLLRKLVPRRGSGEDFSAGIKAIAFSPNQANLVSFPAIGYAIWVWSLVLGKPKELDPPFTGQVKNEFCGEPRVLTDDPTVLVATCDGMLGIIDVRTREPLWVVAAHWFWVRLLVHRFIKKDSLHCDTLTSFTPDGRLGVSGDWSLTVWDIENRRKLHTLVHIGRWIEHLAISRNGKCAVSMCKWWSRYDIKQRSRIDIWDLNHGRRLRSLRSKKAFPFKSIALSPDGQWISTGSDDGRLAVWTSHKSRNDDFLLRDRGVAIHYLLFSDDGRYLISASKDQVLTVWSLERRQLLANFTTDAEITSCAVAPDGLNLVVGDESGHLHFLRFENNEGQSEG